MRTNRKTEAAPRFSASERAVLAALVRRREVAAVGLAATLHLSLATTQSTLHQLESLGAAKCFRRTSLDGRSVRDLWSATVAVHDFFAASGTLPTAQALLARCARDQVLSAVWLRPGSSVEELVQLTSLPRPSIAEALAALEHEALICRVDRKRPRGGLTQGWRLNVARTDEPTPTA